MEVKDDGEKTEQMKMSEREDENDNKEIKMISDGIAQYVKKAVVRQLFPSSLFGRECSIYRVPKLLRNVNPKAYTPQVISIGPFHYKPSPRDTTVMEKKCAYALNFLSIAELSWDKMVEKAIGWEEKARECYGETIKMERGEFLELIILDGCFVVVNIVGSIYAAFGDLDPLFLLGFNNAIFKDLLLLENQLPFFVLHELYDLFVSSNPTLKDVSFIELLRAYFSNARQGMGYVERGFHLDSTEVKHLVDFLRKHLIHPRSQTYNRDSRPAPTPRYPRSGRSQPLSFTNAGFLFRRKYQIIL